MSVREAKRNRSRLGIELGLLKPQWEAHCAMVGVSASEGIRQLVVAVLDIEQDPNAAPSVLRLDSDEGHYRKRIELRLTPDEYDSLCAQSQTLGLSVNRWIVAMIRARLTGQPQFGEREINLLAESNHQLAAICRSLNQIARVMDRVPDQPVLAGEKGISVLKAKIDMHLDCVVDLIHANLKRWSR